MKSQRVAIIGGGIVGLAHAWSASQRGHQVMLFERTQRAEGASIRNFGMVFPLSQPENLWQVADESRKRWLQLNREAGLWLEQCGSLIVAHQKDEWNVLEEFYEINSSSTLGPHLRLIDAEACQALSSAVRGTGLLGGLSCDLELRVEPTTAIDRITQWLIERYSVKTYFGTSVIHVSSDGLLLASGMKIDADLVIICPGSDLETLYPDALAQQPITKCKLQMMRTVAQPADWHLGPHLSGGLTLRHYPPFSRCEQQKHLIERIAAETPELDQFGIHVLVSQDSGGRLILGDSHEYGPDLEPFQSEQIDQLILRELKQIAEIPNWEIDRRWYGVYAKQTGHCCEFFSPEPGVFVCTGLGGSGMTLAFGMAEKIWSQW